MRLNRPGRARKLLGIPVEDQFFTLKIEGEMCFAVRIFKTLGGMRRYLDHIRPDCKHAEDLAFTDEKTCTIVLCRRYCDANTVAHELTHALFWWAYCARLKPAACMRWGSHTHERMATAMGYLAEEFRRKESTQRC